MHDCSGLGPQSSGAPRRWTGELVAPGYVAILPVSFPRRGIANGACTLPLEQPRPTLPAVRSASAYRGVYAPLAPLLILIGEQDDWTPAEPWRRTNLNAPGGKGATTGGNSAAWADAKQQMAAFFNR